MESKDKLSSLDHLKLFFEESRLTVFRALTVFLAYLFGSPLLFGIDINEWIKYGLLVIGAIVTVWLNSQIDRKIKGEVQLKLDPQYEVVFSYISMGLETLLVKMLNSEERTDFDFNLEKLLTYIQCSVTSILNANNVEYTDICVSLMVKKDNTLQLTHFDKYREDRKFTRLEINKKLPGAPKAFVDDRLEYLPNTNVPYLKKHFRGRPYKSIVSLPLTIKSDVNGKNITYGVINLDSKNSDQFVSRDFIETRIATSLNPLLSIIHILYESGKITGEISTTHRKGSDEKERYGICS